MFFDKFIGVMSRVIVQITGKVEETDGILMLPYRIVIKNPWWMIFDKYSQETKDFMKPLFRTLFSMSEFIYFEAKLLLF